MRDFSRKWQDENSVKIFINFLTVIFKSTGCGLFGKWNTNLALYKSNGDKTIRRNDEIILACLRKIK